MFIIAVLCFTLGIYLGVFYDYSLKYLCLSVLAIASVAPFFLTRYRRICVFLIFICLCLIGMIRINILVKGAGDINVNNERFIFEGKLAETSKNIKVLKLSNPDIFKGIHAVLRTDRDLNIGDRIRVFGSITELHETFKNPYMTSWKWIKKLEGIHYEIKGDITGVQEGKGVILNIRKMIQDKINESGARHGAIIKALIIGDKTSIDEDTKSLFQRTGTSHILAISGLHIGIITGFFFFITKWLLGRNRVLRLSGSDKKYASIITILFPLIFMLISGAGISTIRATIMVTIFLLSVFFERQRDLMNTIALCGLAILLIYPHSLFLPSFQLSFLSVVFIVLIMKKVYPLIKTGFKPLKWLVISILTTLSATTGTLPVVAYHFYGVNLFSVLHNLISIPLLCMISIPLCLLGISMPYGEYLVKLAGEIININISIINFLDFGYIFPIIRPNLVEALLFYAVALSLIFIGNRTVRHVFYFVLSPLLIIYIYLALDNRYNNHVCLNLMDVGMGEAMLLEAPKGMRILIDGGGGYKSDFDIGKYIITPILLSKKIKTLDYVINTHPHSDHAGGLPFILKNFYIKSFVIGGYFIKEQSFIEIIKTLKDKNIDISYWQQGVKLILHNGMILHVFNPSKEITEDNLNNTSLVFKIIYRDTSFLFTGDIESHVEKRLIMENMPLKADVLKIPHHGSNNSSSMEFILAVKPKLAVMSVGKGIKGLPGRETLKRYRINSIPVLSTLENGFIRVCTDGRRIFYSNEMGR